MQFHQIIQSQKAVSDQPHLKTASNTKISLQREANNEIHQTHPSSLNTGICCMIVTMATGKF